MLKIRLKRVGRKHDPSYRVVVTEKHRGPKSGKYIEKLGHYDARTNAKTINADRVKHWIGVGAQVSDTVHNLLVSEGVMDGKKKNVLPKKTPLVKEQNTEEKKTSEASKVEEKEEENTGAPEEEKSVEETPVKEVESDPKSDTPAEEMKEEVPSEETSTETEEEVLEEKTEE